MTSLPQIFTGTAPSKTEIEEQSKIIIDQIMEGGDVNPLRVASTIKSLELAAKTIKEGISEYMLTEANKYETKSFDFDGHKFQVKETGVKYDYSLCNDPIYKQLKKDEVELAGKIKAREAFLKSISDQQTIVDEDTGEVVTILPPSKSGTTSVTITLKK